MILVKTETGQQVFKDRSVRLTPRQRSAFILFDGKRSIGEILEACVGVVHEDIDQLIQLGLLGHGGGQATVAAARPERQASAPPAKVIETVGLGGGAIAANEAVAPAPMDGRSSQQRYKDAYPVATQLTSSLGLRGFRLNLAVEGATSFEELLALAPKIRALVGGEKAAVLDRALGI
jgi:hypothetical protein